MARCASFILHKLMAYAKANPAKSSAAAAMVGVFATELYEGRKHSTASNAFATAVYANNFAATAAGGLTMKRQQRIDVLRRRKFADPRRDAMNRVAALRHGSGARFYDLLIGHANLAADKTKNPYLSEVLLKAFLRQVEWLDQSEDAAETEALGTIGIGANDIAAELGVIDASDETARFLQVELARCEQQLKDAKDLGRDTSALEREIDVLQDGVNEYRGGALCHWAIACMRVLLHSPVCDDSIVDEERVALYQQVAEKLVHRYGISASEPQSYAAVKAALPKDPHAPTDSASGAGGGAGSVSAVAVAAAAPQNTTGAALARATITMVSAGQLFLSPSVRLDEKADAVKTIDVEDAVEAAPVKP